MEEEEGASGESLKELLEAEERLREKVEEDPQGEAAPYVPWSSKQPAK